MNIKDLPSAGISNGGGEAITEIYALIDRIIVYDSPSCTCNSDTRCIYCQVQQQFMFKKEALKLRIQELLNKIEAEKQNVQ